MFSGMSRDLNLHCPAPQALDVTAETDGRSPERTEHRPFGSGSALGQAWPAIGAVLLLLAICSGCFAWHWHRRSRRLQRICDAVLERCRRCRRSSSRWRSTVRARRPPLMPCKGLGLSVTMRGTLLPSHSILWWFSPWPR